MHTVFRFLRQLLLTVLLLALLVLVAAGGYFAVTGHKLYESAIQVTPIDTLYSSISSREGFVPYAQLPQTYINAVISAEDSRFTHHKGVDPVSIARALVTDLRTGSFAEGGSTITQQLAKNTLFTQEKHLARKAAEMFAALAIEKQYNKEQIFEMYVNTIYFGSGHYGIGEARAGLLWQNAAAAHRRRSRDAGGPAQCSIGLLAQQQPGPGRQADAGGAQPDGRVQKADPGAGRRPCR